MVKTGGRAMFLSAVLALASSWALFVAGCKFLKFQLCRGTFHELDPVVSTLFAVTFALSAGLLVLVLYEILGLVDESFLRVHWRFNLRAVLVLLIFVLPFVHLHRFFTLAVGWRAKPRRAVAASFFSDPLFTAEAVSRFAAAARRRCLM